jgi:phosphate transport system protein
MTQHFGDQLESFRRQLVAMGADVERQIRLAVEAVVEADAGKARRVIAGDAAVDQQEVKNEEDGILLLATQQPVAVDLRLIVAALRINSDLERIADHAVNIAECAERMADKRPFKPWIDIPMMADVARGMLKDSLDAFVRRDAALALDVCRRDDILDERNRGLIRELLTYMAENPSLISYCIEIMSVSKNLERVGDLATNICEGTIYFVQGRMIKHAFGPKHQEETP